MIRQSRIILPTRETPCSATAESPSTSNPQIRPFVLPLIGQSPTRCTRKLRHLFLARSEPNQRFVDLDLRAIGELLLFAERTYIRVEKDFEILTRLEETRRLYCCNHIGTRPWWPSDRRRCTWPSKNPFQRVCGNGSRFFQALPQSRSRGILMVLELPCQNARCAVMTIQLVYRRTDCGLRSDTYGEMIFDRSVDQWI